MSEAKRYRRATKKVYRQTRIAAQSSNESGAALIIVLLLLTMMSALGVMMAYSVNSDMMINGYYGNYRGSFYAADSGLNIARQQIANQIAANVNTTPCVGWGAGGANGCTSDPLPANVSTTILNYINSQYGGSFSSLNSGDAVNSWLGNFQIANWSGVSTPCTNSVALASGYPKTTQNAQGLNTAYTYQYNYILCAYGQAKSLTQVKIQESGSILATINAQTSTSQQTQTSFAAFGAFINNYPPCPAQGSGPLVPGTMTGPMFTNGAWQFGTGGSYIFTDPVGQTNANADYWFGNNCIPSPTTSLSHNGQTIKPTFEGGLNLSQPTAPLPPNDYSQQWAVLDGKGCGEGGSTCGQNTPPAPSSAQMSAALKDVSGTSYPNSSSGVYLPYCTGGSNCTSANTVNGGGIWVDKDATIQLSIGTDASSNPTQIYTITTGSTVTTITTNATANTTTVTSGNTTLNLTGVPENLTGSSPQPGTLVYVNGKINSLSGPGQGQPAIQDHSQLTIAAASNINITGDVIYKHEPVTMDANDTLIAGNDYNQVLGIFTANGNINLSSSYSNKNLEVDGSLAAIGQNCAANSCGFTVSGSINTFNNVGGQIQSNIFSASMQTENTYFDRRFTQKQGFAPPWFPSTTLPTVDVQNAQAPQVIVSQPQRLSWSVTPQN